MFDSCVLCMAKNFGKIDDSRANIGHATLSGSIHILDVESKKSPRPLAHIV
jgi:hypothetical protein